MDWFVILRGPQWPLVAEGDFRESAVPGCWQTTCEEVDPDAPFVVLTKKGDRLYVPAGDVVCMGHVSELDAYGFSPPSP